MSKNPAGGLHEDFTRPDAVAVGSDRNFGLTFTVVFALVGLWPAVHGLTVRIWALGLAALFLLVSLAFPAQLSPLKLLWLRLGLLLHKIVTPLVMGLIFYGAVTPTGLIMRAMGKDPLRLKRDPAATSYWIIREPPGPPPGSIRNQF